MCVFIEGFLLMKKQDVLGAITLFTVSADEDREKMCENSIQDCMD